MTEYTTMTIDLELEDWGRVALIAHRENLTINQTIEYLLRMAIAMETGCDYVDPYEPVEVKDECCGCGGCFEVDLVRLAQNAEAARLDPGENLSGLSRDAFIDALLDTQDDLRNPDAGC